MVNGHKAVIAVFWWNVVKSRPSSRLKKYLIISCSITRSCCPFFSVHLTSSRGERCFRMQINECEHLLLISSLCSHSAWSYSWDCYKSFGVHIRVSHNWLQRALYIHQRDPSLRIRRAPGRITQLNRVKACAPLQISKSCFHPHVCSEKGLLKHTNNTVVLVYGLINSYKNTSILCRRWRKHLEVFDK